MKHAETQGKHAASHQAEAAQDVKSQDAHSKKLQGSHVGKSQGVHDKTPQGSRGVNSKGAPAGKPQGAHAAEPLFEGEGQSAALPLGIGAFILVVVLVVNVLIPWISTNPWENISISLPQFAQPQANDTSNASDNEQASDKKSYTLTTKSLDAIPASPEGITTFNLADKRANAPELSADQIKAIEDAIEVIEASGSSVDIVFMDLDTGMGLSYNCDEDIYGASSFKGPFCVWIAEEKLDTGLITLDSVGSRVEPTIEWSDNNQYASLRNSFSNDELADWLEEMDLDRSIAYDTNYPFLTARESAKLWVHVYQYLFNEDNNSEYAAWTKDLFTITKMSMIRDGITSTYDLRASELQLSDESNISDENILKVNEDSVPVVYNKAGWVSGYHVGADVDAGIIELGNHHYVMSVMTSQFDSVACRQNVADLVAALWPVHSALSE